MGKIIGIDLGTTNSVVSVMEGGEAKVIQNKEGNRTTPSVVAFNKEGEVLVGEVAKRQAITNPDRTIRSVKRHMGTNWSTEIDGKKYTSQEISARTLMKLKRDAEAYLARARALGAHDYLTKPFEPRELLARIDAALRIRRSDDEAVRLVADRHDPLQRMLAALARLDVAQEPLDLVAVGIREAAAHVQEARRVFGLDSLAGRTDVLVGPRRRGQGQGSVFYRLYGPEVPGCRGPRHKVVRSRLILFCSPGRILSCRCCGQGAL